MIQKLVLVFSTILFSTSLFADSYHNRGVFIGERASGMGGAFTAISDDPSGMYYNPAGIAFAYENYFSISANTYDQTIKNYQDVFGPGQSYARKSSTFAPNFFGSVKSFDKMKIGLSFVNPQSESYDQSNEIFNPFSLPSVSRFRIDYSEENDTYLIGPSIGYALSEKLSVGATLYYMQDTSKISSTQFVEGTNKSFSHISIRDRRRTLGFVPILGIQYMPTEKWALGASLRYTKVTGKERSIVGHTSTSSSLSTDSTNISNVTQDRGASLQDNLIFLKPGDAGGIPELYEFRVGSAHFLSQNLIIAYDVVYTSAYTHKQDRTQYELTKPYIYFTDNEDLTLSREETMNYSIGLEYFIIDSVAIRLGYYTNQSNHKKVDWLTAAMKKIAAANNQNLLTVNNTTPLSFYAPNALNPDPRFEQVNNNGYTLGMSWATASNSVTMTYVLERGRGGSQINSSQLPGILKYYSSSLYLVASTHQ